MCDEDYDLQTVAKRLLALAKDPELIASGEFADERKQVELLFDVFTQESENMIVFAAERLDIMRLMELSSDEDPQGGIMTDMDPIITQLRNEDNVLWKRTRKDVRPRRYAHSIIEQPVRATRGARTGWSASQ